MRLRSLCCALICCVILCLPAAAAPSVSAVSAILVDVDSGRVLYQNNAQEQRLIASITKLMTALVAVEARPDLQEPVKIEYEWTLAEGSSIYLRQGETLKLETLLYGLLLQSGNDAALAIAGHCAGDVDTFVDWMNQRAADLGMTRTHFANPNGLNDDTHYSTAGDMAKLARACLENPQIAEIVATRSISMEGRTFTNHNKLLWQYKGCIGMKTGYTQMAGRTLITAAQRDGQRLAVVTLCDPNDWEDHKNLFDYGFETYPRQVFCEAGEKMGRIPVEGSLIRSVSVAVAEELSYPLKEGEQVEKKITLPQSVEAPVEQGDIAGEVVYTLDGKEVGRSYLLYETSVHRDTVAASHGIRWMLDLFKARETGGVTAVLAQCFPTLLSAQGNESIPLS